MWGWLYKSLTMTGRVSQTKSKSRGVEYESEDLVAKFSGQLKQTVFLLHDECCQGVSSASLFCLELSWRGCGDKLSGMLSTHGVRACDPLVIKRIHALLCRI